MTRKQRVQPDAPAPTRGERISDDDLAYTAAVEQQVSTALAVQASWHGYLCGKYGLRAGDQFDRRTGAITRMLEGEP